MALDPASLRALATRVAGALLAERGLDQPGPRSAGVHLTARDPRPAAHNTAHNTGPATWIDGAAAAAAGSALHAPAGARWTPLAEEEAILRHLEVHGAGADHLRPGSLRVAIGSDHGGYALKALLKEELARWGHRVLDLGTHDTGACDYPDFAAAVAEAVRDGRAQLGCVVDGAGLGSAMAANKFPGIRAAPCGTVELARNARAHNHANVLTLGASHLDAKTAREVLRAFLTTPPGEERHRRRVDKITALERKYSPGAHTQSFP